MSLIDFNYRNGMLALAGGALAVGAAVLGGGCGGGIATEADFCQQLAQAQCSQAVVTACFGASDANVDADTQTCINSRSLPSRCNPAGLPFHADTASDCVAAQSDAYADGTLTPDLVQAVHDACLAVFNRGGANGTSCTADTDCDVTNGLRCVTHEGGKGSCRLPTLVNPGDPCSEPSSQCTQGDYCNATGNCVANPGLKQSCGAGKPCGTGFTCDGGTSLCKPQQGSGAACTAVNDPLAPTSDECAGGFCVAATGSMTGICADNYQLELTTAICAEFRAPASTK